MEIIDPTNHEKPVVTLNSNDKDILIEALKNLEEEENLKLLKKIGDLKTKSEEEEVQLTKHEVSLLRDALETKWKGNYSDDITRKLLENFDRLRSQINSARTVDPNDIR